MGLLLKVKIFLIIDDLFDEGIQPKQNKWLVPKPPPYEESLADALEGKKQIYIDVQ